MPPGKSGHAEALEAYLLGVSDYVWWLTWHKWPLRTCFECLSMTLRLILVKQNPNKI